MEHYKQIEDSVVSHIRDIPDEKSFRITILGTYKPTDKGFKVFNKLSMMSGDYEFNYMDNGLDVLDSDPTFKPCTEVLLKRVYQDMTQLRTRLASKFKSLDVTCSYIDSPDYGRYYMICLTRTFPVPQEETVFTTKCKAVMLATNLLLSLVVLMGWGIKEYF